MWCSIAPGGAALGTWIPTQDTEASLLRQHVACSSVKFGRTSRQSSLTSKSGKSNSRTSVRSTSRASQKSARSQASVASKASGRAKSTMSSRRGSSNVHQKNRTGKGRCRGSNKGRDNSNKGKAPRSKKRQRPQEQPKSKFTVGGNKHRPRRRSFWLSDTELDMGAFSALQAKRVNWSMLARRLQLNRVHTVNVNTADIPGFVQNFAGKSLKFIPVVKPQSSRSRG